MGKTPLVGNQVPASSVVTYTPTGPDTSDNVQDGLDARMLKDQGTYKAARADQAATYVVSDSGSAAITIDFSLGNEQSIRCDSADAMTFTVSNWPTTEAASIHLSVSSNNASGCGSANFSALTPSRNSAPDFSGITADANGYGDYIIKWKNGAWMFTIVEEA